MHQHIQLKTLSPVHIGGRIQEITPLEAVVFNGNCYVVDETKLGYALLKQNRLDSLSIEISKQGSNFNLKDYLQHLKLLNEGFLEKISAYRCPTKLNFTPNRLRPFVRDAYNCPFMPGSSIKGVLRTAVLYGVLKKIKEEKPQQFQSDFINTIKAKLKEYYDGDEWQRSKPWFKDKIKSNVVGLIERKLLQSFDLPLDDRFKARGPTVQQKDIMRAVKVSDTSSLEKDFLSLEEVQVASLTGENYTYPKTSIYVEAIPSNIELEFSVTLDENILSDFSRSNKDKLPFSSLEDIMSLLNEFTKDLWEFEDTYWKDIYGQVSMEMMSFYHQEPAGMRIGWGSGLSGTSMLMLLPEELRNELRDALFEPRPKYVFPKSRRLVTEGDDPRWPLGWLKLSLI